MTKFQSYTLKSKYARHSKKSLFIRSFGQNFISIKIHLKMDLFKVMNIFYFYSKIE